MRAVLFFASLVFFMSDLGAALKFDTEVIESVLEQTEKDFRFEFKFKNTGSRRVSVGDIVTSCGCTVVELTKKSYGTGEEGLLKGVFKLEGRKGIQRKEIVLKTDDLMQRNIVLKLNLNILEIFSAKPGMVFWNVGDDSETKFIDIKVAEQCGTKIKYFECGNINFDIKLLDNPKVEGGYKLAVTPSDIGKASYGLIKLTVSKKGAKDKTFFLHALVKSFSGADVKR